jgi:hypothetical protein
MRLAPLAFAALVVASASTAGADIPPPASHRIQESATLDYGPFSGHVTWRVQGKAGETLAAIAERELGAAARKDEVATLNPTLAATLAADAEVRLPPKDANAAGPRDVSWWEMMYVVVASGPVSPHPMPMYPGEKMPLGVLTLFAVPHAKSEELLKDRRRFASDPSVLRSEEISIGGYAQDSDRTTRMDSRYELAVDGRRLKIEVLEQTRYDKDGNTVSHSTGSAAPVPGGGIGGGLLLTILVVAGAMLLSIGSYLVRKRRPRAQPSPS